MPAEYVGKISRMFQDVKVSEDLNQQFKDSIRATRGAFAGQSNFKKQMFVEIYCSRFAEMVILGFVRFDQYQDT